MALFQKSVTNKYIKNLDKKDVDEAYENFRQFYGDKKRIANIMRLQEENYQEGFLREIFVQTLGYTINPDENYNLTTEFKNQKDSRKADGAIIRNGKAIGVIELKSTKTKDLNSIKEQAFGYKNNQPDCRYVITSNFQSLRFYLDNATEYEEFDLFAMADGRDVSRNVFSKFYLLLSKESVFSDLPRKLKQETQFHEEKISAQLYADYKQFKDKIFNNLVKRNPQYDKLTLFKKSQKLLDRFLFVFFAEDIGLIPPNTISKIIEQWKQLQELDEYKTLYSRFQKLFTHLDKGHTYKNWGEIPAYNGGLFRNDDILDNPETVIDDKVLENDSVKLSRYDFSTDVDVNILGHIFEHSLSEIEEIERELTSSKFETLTRFTSKRKKDGVFYTPKYITKYIVENTVGKLCDEKKAELQIKNLLIDDSFRKKDEKPNQRGKQLFDTLNAYKDWLLTLKILDPACGSGAFLNATLEFLIAEHKETDDKIAELTGETLRLHDTDIQILENNIYGVDINEESIEIAKLSLWLRTARRGRTLSDLSGNIKCGNSLIDSPEVAGEKAFDWEKEFPHVFNPESKKKVYQKMPESKPDYARLIKDEAQKAEKLAQEAAEISKKVYEYAEKIPVTNEPAVPYGVKQGGFDVVLGNPPYVRLQGIKTNYEKESLFYENNYTSATANYDIYVLFLEKALELINSKGKVSFILPHKFLISEFGKGIRKLFVEKQAAESVLHFGSEMVFADAATYTCIINLSSKNNTLKFKQVNPHKITEPFIFDSISYEKLDAGKWRLNTPGVARVMEKINQQPLRVKDVFAKIFVGLQTSGDKAYLIKGNRIGNYIEGYSKALDRNVKIESAFAKPLLKGEDISRYNELRNQYFVIFPYSIENGKASPMTENFIKDNFPLGYEYLKSNEDYLRGRERGKMDKEGWFLYIYPKSLAEFEQPKIITSYMGTNANMSYDNGKYYHNTKCYSFIKNEKYKENYLFYLSVLNSSTFWFFIKNTSTVFRGGYYTFATKQVEPFPLPQLSDISGQNDFVDKTNEMFSLNKKLYTEKVNFLSTVKEEKGIEKITKKLDSFYQLEYEAFKKELKKQKIKISLGEENNEWREYFNTTKQKINDLQSQIHQTDKEIDKMVYKLYELTPDEIELIENSFIET